jgi:hypothetical protein
VKELHSYKKEFEGETAKTAGTKNNKEGGLIAVPIASITEVNRTSYPFLFIFSVEIVATHLLDLRFLVAFW